jgi:hypothetical protein
MEGTLNLVTIKPFANPIRQQMPRVKIKAASGIWITFHNDIINIGAKAKTPCTDKSNSLQVNSIVNPRLTRIISGVIFNKMDNMSGPALGKFIQ